MKQLTAVTQCMTTTRVTRPGKQGIAWQIHSRQHLLGEGSQATAHLGGRPAGPLIVLLPLHSVQDGHDPVLEGAVVGVGHQQVAHPVEAPLAQVGAPQVEVPCECGPQTLRSTAAMNRRCLASTGVACIGSPKACQEACAPTSANAQWTSHRMLTPEQTALQIESMEMEPPSDGMQERGLQTRWYDHLYQVLLHSASCRDQDIYHAMLHQVADVLAHSRRYQVGCEAQEYLCAHTAPVHCALAVRQWLITEAPVQLQHQLCVRDTTHSRCIHLLRRGRYHVCSSLLAGRQP